MTPRITIGLAVLVALVAAYIFAVDRPQAQRAEEARHLVRLAKAEITAVTLESPKGTVDLRRGDAAHWEITRPFQAPADAFAVGDLLDAATGIVPQRTLRNAGSDLASYGLDKPGVRMTLRASGGGTVTVELGRASPVATALYARLDPGSAVYLLDTSVKGSLSKSAADLRQKTLTDFANADVQQVRIASPKGTLTVDRLGLDRWRLEGAHPWPADDFKVTDLFFPLTTSNAKKFHDGVTDLAPYGLERPPVTVTLTLKGRKDPLRILLARRGKVTYGMVAGSHTVLELDGAAETKLMPDPISLVSQRVLPYNPQDLTAVVWRRNGRSLEVRRQGPGFTGGGLTDTDISDMFSSVNLLDADKVQALSSPPPGAPAFEIQTDGAQDARFLVKFHTQSKGGWIAVDEALDLEYTLSAGALDGLPKPIKSFLGLAQAKKATAAPKTPASGTSTSAPARAPATKPAASTP